MKQKLALFFSLLTLVLIISTIMIYPNYREYVRQTFQLFYPPIFFLAPCIYLFFGIALVLLAFKEIRTKQLRRILLFVGFVPVIVYVLMGLRTLAGIGLGRLTWTLIQVQQYHQIFFFPGIFIGMWLNPPPRE